MGTLTRINGGVPTRFQYGDYVTAVLTIDEPRTNFCAKHGPYPKGTEVQGRIVNAVNGEARMLDLGRVEVRLDNGDRLWVKATSVLSTAGERLHPLAEVVPGFIWRCSGCTTTGHALTEAKAAEDHNSHANHHAGRV